MVLLGCLSVVGCMMVLGIPKAVLRLLLGGGRARTGRLSGPDPQPSHDLQASASHVSRSCVWLVQLSQRSSCSFPSLCVHTRGFEARPGEVNPCFQSGCFPPNPLRIQVITQTARSSPQPGCFCSVATLGDTLAASEPRSNMGCWHSYIHIFAASHLQAL